MLLVEFLREETDGELKLYAVQMMRRGTATESRQTKEVGEVLVKCGVGEVLEALLAEQELQVVAEALWCLINLTSEDTICPRVISTSLLSKVLNLLSVSNLEIVGNALWVIGNVAGDGVNMLALLMSLEALQRILMLAGRFREFPVNIQSSLVWTIGNFFRLEQAISKRLTFETVLLLKDISRPNQEEILVETSWALHHISSTNQGVRTIVQAGFIPHLVSLLEHSNVKIINAALRTIGSVIAEGDANDLNALKNAGFVEGLERLTEFNFKAMHREIVWILGNVVLDASEEVMSLIQTKLVDFVFRNAVGTGEEIQSEVSFFLISAFTGPIDPDFAWKLYETGALEVMRGLLDCCKAARTVLNVLCALDGLLELGNSSPSKVEVNPVAAQWEELGGVTMLERLQEFPSSSVYHKTVELMEKYYGLIETEESVVVLAAPTEGRFEFS